MISLEKTIKIKICLHYVKKTSTCTLAYNALPYFMMHSTLAEMFGFTCIYNKYDLYSTTA